MSLPHHVGSNDHLPRKYGKAKFKISDKVAEKRNLGKKNDSDEALVLVMLSSQKRREAAVEEELKLYLTKNYFEMSPGSLELLVSHLRRRSSSSYREVITPGQCLTARQADC